MKTYFVDLDMPNSQFRSTCLQAAYEKNSRIIVPNEKTKETVEGVFWVDKVKPLSEVVIDKAKFLTGEDVYLAVVDSHSESAKSEWNNLVETNKAMYNKVAANLIKRINEKGGW